MLPLKFFLILFFSFFICFKVFASFKVEKISVKGNSSNDSSTIIAYSKLNSGLITSDAHISKAIKFLYATGFFSNVKIISDSDSGEIVIEVEEIPIISSIKFNNLKTLKKDDIITELSSKEKAFYSKEKAINDSKRLEAIYQQTGYLGAEVHPLIERESAKKIKLIFDVKTGKKSEVSKLVYFGNKEVSTSSLLEDSIITQKSWFSFLSSKSLYSKQKVEQDISRIKKFYSTVGFPKVEISYSASINYENDITLTYFISEGKKYKFGQTNLINAIDNLKNDEILELQKNLDKSLKAGKRFNVNLIDREVDAISKILQKEGFVLSQVKPKYSFDDEKLEVNTSIQIFDSSRVYVNKINILGNTKTNDNVIRREILIKEGDVYNMEKMKRSLQRIRNLGYFSDVQINEANPNGDPSLVDLTINVVEGSTAQINGSLGYDVAYGLVLNGGYTQSNIAGMGYGGSVMVEKTTYSRSANVSFTNPYIFDKRLSLSTTFGAVSSSNNLLYAYSMNSAYGNFTVSYPLTEYLRHSITYGLRRDELQLFDSSGTSSSYSRFITEQIGEFATSSVGQVFFYDKRDSSILPTNGYSLRFSQNLAGLGGNISFVSNEVSSEKYFTTFDRDDMVIGLKARTGYIFGYGGRSVNIKDRYFLGGTMGMRGFDFRGIGPRVQNVYDGVYDVQGYGGKGFYITSFEYRIPNFIPKNYGLITFAFVDAGNVFGVDDSDYYRYDISGNAGIVRQSSLIRASVGVGVSWKSPMGLIGFTFAHPVVKESYDTERRFLLNIGNVMM